MNMPRTSAETGTAPLEIKVWIDFVCPYCLLGKTVLDEATQGLDVEIAWMPFELRPYPVPTLRPEDDYLPAAWNNGVYPTARRMGVDIKLPTVSPQPYTRLAFLGLQYASAHGKADEYVAAVLHAFFQRDLNIGKMDILKSILGDLGLSPEGIDEKAASLEANSRHDQALREGKAFNVQAVPSFAIENTLYSGLPDSARLRSVLLSQLN